MLFIPFDEAWRVYRAAHDRLPSLPPPVSPQRIAGVQEVFDRYDLLAFDAYGVLHCGGSAFPQAVTALRAARARGLAVCVVTNDVTRQPSAVADGLRQRGFDIQDDEIISGRSLLPAVLAQVQKKEQTFGLISSAPAEAAQALSDFSLRPMVGAEGECDAVDGFVFIDNNAWSEGDPQRYAESLRKNPRPVVVCNPDVGCPYLGEISAEPGYYAHLWAEEFGIAPVFLGKPYPAIYHALFQRFPAIPLHRMLMIGDSPHTDVLGARGVGMDCLLVESGFLAEQNSLERCQQSGLWPNWISSFV